MRSIVWRGGRVRSNAPDLKSGDGLNRPGVRIPPSPPYFGMAVYNRYPVWRKTSTQSVFRRDGRVRSNAPDLKSGDGSNRPGVRIPLSPPYTTPDV